MGAKGITLAEECHVMNLLGPVDINTGALTSLYCNLENYAHATIIVTMGVTGADTTIKLYEGGDNTGTPKQHIGFSYYEEKTDGGDTLTTRLTATSAGGFTCGTNDDTTFVIEIDASELSDGYEWLAILTSNPTATFISIIAVLSGSRYKSDPLKGHTAL